MAARIEDEIYADRLSFDSISRTLKGDFIVFAHLGQGDEILSPVEAAIVVGSDEFSEGAAVVLIERKRKDVRILLRAVAARKVARNDGF